MPMAAQAGPELQGGCDYMKVDSGSGSGRTFG